MDWTIFWTIFGTIFFDHFIKGEAHHLYSGRGGMQSISTEGGLGGTVILLKEG